MQDSELTQRLATADTVAAAHAACTEVAGALGFSQFLYGLRLPVPLTRPCQLILSGYSTQWRSRYDEQCYMATDPVLQRAIGSPLPVEWDRVDRSQPRNAQMFAEAAECGLVHGISLPVHGGQGEFSLLSLAGPDALPAAPGARMELAQRALWFAAHMHEAVRRIALQPVPRLRGELPAQLTARERDCLSYAADGLSAADIGQRLRITERTVVFHLGRCQEKLQAGSRQHAVARAVALGEVRPKCYPDRLAQSQQFVEHGLH